MKKLLIYLFVLVIFSSTILLNYKKSESASLVAGGTTVAVTTAELVAFTLSVMGCVAVSELIYTERDRILDWGYEQLNKIETFCKNVLDYDNDKIRSVKGFFSSLVHGRINVKDIGFEAVKKYIDYECNKRTIQPKTTFIDQSMNSISSVSEHKISHEKVVVYKFSNQFDQRLFYIQASTPDVKYKVFTAKSLRNSCVSTYFVLYSPNYYVINNHIGDSYTPDFQTSGGTYFDLFVMENYDVMAYKEDLGDYINEYEYITDRESLHILDEDGTGSATALNLFSHLIDGTDYKYFSATNIVSVTDVTPDELTIVNDGVVSNEVAIDWRKVIDDEDTLADALCGYINVTDKKEGIATLDKDAGIVLVNENTAENVLTEEKEIVDSYAKDLQLKDYKVSLTNIFPFCLPFDLIDFIKCLDAEPTAPYFEIPIAYISDMNMNVKYHNIVIDFNKFETVAKVIRVMNTLLFCVGLIMITRNRMIKS